MTSYTLSRYGRKYILVIMDGFSRYTWTNFLRKKLDTFDAFNYWSLKVQNDKDKMMRHIHSDHGENLCCNILLNLSQL